MYFPPFPNYKKAFIEARRAFVATAVGEAVLLLHDAGIRATLFSDTTIIAKCLIALDKVCFLGASIWANAWVLLVVPTIAAGYKGVVKYIQETWGQSDYSHWSYKL